MRSRNKIEICGVVVDVERARALGDYAVALQRDASEIVSLHLKGEEILLRLITGVIKIGLTAEQKKAVMDGVAEYGTHLALWKARRP